MVDKKLSDIALSDDDVEEIEDVVSPIVIASIPLWRGSDVVPVEGATPVKYPPNPAAARNFPAVSSLSCFSGQSASMSSASDYFCLYLSSFVISPSFMKALVPTLSSSATSLRPNRSATLWF